MLSRNEMEPEFKAFGYIWEMWKFQDELQHLSPEEEDRVWGEIVGLLNKIETAIDKDEEKCETFIEMGLKTIDYLELVYKKNKK